MTRSTQDKTLAMLGAIAKDNGLEMIHNPQWANTGILRFEAEDSLTAVLSITYGFYDNYSGFTLSDPSFGKKGDGQLHYVKPDELGERLIEPVRAFLGAR